MTPPPRDTAQRGRTLNAGANGGFSTGLWTLVALVAFAGNSVLCRAALLRPEDGAEPLSPVAFTGIRLFAGAIILAPFLRGSSPKALAADLDKKSVLAMVFYAVAFSLSYVTLPAGAGALILFGTVQITMVVAAALGRESVRPLRILGMLMAFAGLVRLVTGRSSEVGAAQGAGPIDPWGAALMVIAGACWGIYTLRGRSAASPTRTTALNFAGALPAAITLGAWAALDAKAHWPLRGVWLAVASGALTSGVGYAIWYHALRGHSRTSAAVVQLTVPIIAALGGALLLSEPITRPLIESTALTLVGVAIAVHAGARRA